jgi:hypothetical protein
VATPVLQLSQQMELTSEPASPGDQAPRSMWQTWEKQVLSARGFKRVGRHSEYAM